MIFGYAQKSYVPENNESILALNNHGKSLFDYKPTEKDFLPTLPLTAEINAFLVDSKSMAETITSNYDAIRKAEKEARGQKWQTSRRGTKQVVMDRRAEDELKKELEKENKNNDL